MIGNILAAHVSPSPTFECRFIKKEAGHNLGVLVIHVFEGVNPPYVSKGTVYVRNGSNKIPINANRSDIDILFAKGENHLKSLSDLISSPVGGSAIINPFCNVAMYNLQSSDNRIRLKDIEKIELEIKNKRVFASSIRSAESVIFLTSEVICPNGVTSYVEMFYNTNVRLVVHIPCFNKQKRDIARDYILKENNSINLGDFVLIDFCALYLFINSMIMKTLIVLEMLKQPLNQYLIQCEFRNTRDSMFYFDPINEFWEYTKANGMKYSLKDIQRTLHFQIPKSKSTEEEIVFYTQVNKCFASAFGYDISTYYKLHDSLYEKYPSYFESKKRSFEFNYNRT